MTITKIKQNLVLTLILSVLTPSVQAQQARTNGVLWISNSSQSLETENSTWVNPQTGITLETWAFIAAPGGTLFLNSDIGGTDTDRSYEVYFQVLDRKWVFSTQLYFEGGGHLIFVTNVAPNMTWNHIAMTYDSATGKLVQYLNGDIVGTMTGQTNKLLKRTTQHMAIGSNIGWWKSSPVGFFDEIRVWTRARSQAEIRFTMNTPLTGLNTGLGGYWNFNSGYQDVTGHTVSSLRGCTNVSYYTNPISIEQSDTESVKVKFTTGLAPARFVIQVSDTAYPFSWADATDSFQGDGEVFTALDLLFGTNRFYRAIQVPY